MVTIAGTSLYFAVHSRFQRKTYLNEKKTKQKNKQQQKLSPGAIPTERIKCDLNRWLSEVFQVLCFNAVRTLFGVTQLRRLWLRYDRQWVKWRLKVPASDPVPQATNKNRKLGCVGLKFITLENMGKQRVSYSICQVKQKSITFLEGNVGISIKFLILR